ncbi:MAG TPA: hypothetical protein VK809_09380 [Bacteroidia bacterium]|jgi:hypothetical protein|nr:hypothetical protein [Bacteroidia bacterium]
MENTTEPKIKVLHYIAALFAGFFLANVVPHFIHGISGDPFPTPFASPPGKGLSSPTCNVLWACFNLLVGYILLKVSKATWNRKLLLFFVFLGIVICGIMLSIAFQDKVKE